MTTASQAGLAPAREVLANGAVIVAKESRATPAVTLHLAFDAGTIFDPPSAGGVAHFLSRILDRGTRSRNADQIAEDFDSRGASLALTVNRHSLSVVCTCLVEDFAAVLTLLGDIVMHPTFPPAEVEVRRTELVTLIRQDEDNPAAVSTEHLMSALYGSSHPYGRRPRGSVESVERITRDDLLAFHEQRFTPSTLRLVIVGDIAASEAVRQAASVFGGWATNRPTDPGWPDIQWPNSRQLKVVPMMNKAQVDIAYGFVTILRSDPRYYAYSLMNNVLGQYSLGGRLGDSIREKQGMAYYVFSALDANVIPGPLMIRAGVNPSNVDRAVSSIDAELTSLAAEGPTEREITESKQYLIGSMPRTLETNLGIANFLQMVEFFGLGLDHDARLPALLSAVTREDVHDAARTLDTSRATVVVAGPYAS